MVEVNEVEHRELRVVLSGVRPAVDLTRMGSEGEEEFVVDEE
jgi:hypothetical protein